MEFEVHYSSHKSLQSLILAETETEAEVEVEAEACCSQRASTVTCGIRPHWDPWPYICSLHRPLHFIFFSVRRHFWKEEWLVLSIISRWIYTLYKLYRKYRLALYSNILSRVGDLRVTYKTGSWIGRLDLLTPYTQHSVLQAIVAVPLFGALYSSPLQTQ
jgi:hypothetical protein